MRRPGSRGISRNLDRASRLAKPPPDGSRSDTPRVGFAFAVRRARKTFDALDRSVVQEVRDAVDQARTAWNVARLYRDRSIPLTRDNLDLSRKSYTAGRASFLAVLEAQRFFLDSRSRYVEALTGAATTLPELARTIGLPVETIMAGVDDALPNRGPDDSKPEDGVEP